MNNSQENSIESPFFIENGKIVAEFGYNNPWLKELLPENCEYIPIACSLQSDAETDIIYNIKHYDFPNIYVDITVLSTSLENIDDMDWFIEQITNHSNEEVLLSSSCWDNKNITLNKNKVFSELVSKFNINGFDIESEINIDENTLFFFKRTKKRNAYGVIIYPCISQNLGDYTQAAAAIAITKRPEDAVYLRREELHNYRGRPLPLICNGWFSHTAISPTALRLRPLYISIHITKTAQKWFNRPDVLAHLAQYSPIGCRDLSTMQFLQSHNIKAYESKCLTLALGRSIVDNSVKDASARDNTIYLVDPPIFKPSGILNKLIFVIKGLTRPALIKKAWILSSGYTSFVWKIYFMLCFSSGYRDIIDSIGIQHIVFHTQHLPLCQGHSQFRDINADLMRKIKAYQSARAVITGRIHVALPASAAGSNIIFLVMGNNSIEEKNRISDHANYFNTYITIANNKLSVAEVTAAINKTESKSKSDEIISAVNYQKQLILNFLLNFNK